MNFLKVQQLQVTTFTISQFPWGRNSGAGGAHCRIVAQDFLQAALQVSARLQPPQGSTTEESASKLPQEAVGRPQKTHFHLNHVIDGRFQAFVGC